MFRGGVTESMKTQRKVTDSAPCITLSPTERATMFRVQVLTKKKQLGHTVYLDRRGAAKKPRKYFPELREQIRTQIEQFPVEENRYGRNKSEKKYLSPDLNMNRLYIAFKKKYPQTIATYRCFYDVFKKDFPNLRFARPRSDTCSTCDLYQNKMRCSADPIEKAQIRSSSKKSRSC
ncbi:hypothetical protein QE152_g8773 [Popillia japonica]|uniref:Uncharacterized protein n=1 Tax=Popillia japonica TaxID=7064 RepID=A0AAW1M1L3_POPJA